MHSNEFYLRICTARRLLTVSLFSVAIALCFTPTSVSAEGIDGCTKRKVKAHKKDLSCRYKQGLAAVRDGLEVADGDHDACDDHLERRFQKAEEKYGEECETLGDADSIGHANLAHTARALAQLGATGLPCPSGTTSTPVTITFSDLLGDRPHYTYPDQAPPGTGLSPVSVSGNCGAGSGTCGSPSTKATVLGKYNFCFANTPGDMWPVLTFEVAEAGCGTGPCTFGTFDVDPNQLDGLEPGQNVLLSGDAYGQCLPSCVEFKSGESGAASLWVCPGVKSCP